MLGLVGGADQQAPVPLCRRQGGRHIVVLDARCETPVAVSTIRVQAVDRPGFLASVKAYVALTKPRIIELLLVTTVPTMILARRGMPGIWLVLATLVGGTCAAGGANAINMYVDRDIDVIM